MGFYINPENETKEEFLEREGIFLGFQAPEWKSVPKDHLPICLVQNTLFTAAAICWKPGEIEAFDHPDDHRPKKWFQVEIGKLMKVSNLPASLIADRVLPPAESDLPSFPEE